jgi:hypothetical protein
MHEDGSKEGEDGIVINKQRKNILKQGGKTERMRDRKNN